MQVQVRTKTEYHITVDDDAFRLLCACVAQCAGVRTFKIDQDEAFQLNLELVRLEVAHKQEQLKVAQQKQEKLTKLPNEGPDA